MLSDILYRLRSLLRRNAVEGELDDELRFHFEHQVEKYIQSGLSREEALRRARLTFGGLDQVKEECREARGVGLLETLAQDIRYSLRTLRKTPGFTAVAVFTLSLGIGANTAIFSMIDWMLLRPLRVKDPGQLTYLVVQRNDGGYSNGFSYPNFEDIRQQTASAFSYVAGVQPFQMDGLNVDGNTSSLWTNYVTGDFFPMLGIQPALGRFIAPSEGKVAGADPVLVLSYSFWQSRFGGDAGIVGKHVAVNGRPVTVIGVAPKGFRGVLSVLETQGYLPLSMASANMLDKKDFLTNRQELAELIIIARRKPGVSLTEVQPLVNLVAKRLAQAYPKIDEWKSMTARALTAAPLSANPANPVPIVAGIFLFLAGLVLLLACVNIAALLLVRGNVRGRELAVRSALGASRSRLARQSLTDSLLLALLGCAGGIVLGIVASRGLNAIPLGTAIPVVLDFTFNWRVLAYAVAAALATGIATGIVPAVRASRFNANDVLLDSGRSVTAGRQTLRSALVVAEVSVSLMLLVVAGLFVRSLSMVQHVDLGFDPSHVLNVTIDPHEAGYDKLKSRRFFDDLLARVRRAPGIQSAGVTGTVPLGMYHYSDSLTIEGYQPAKGEQAPSAGYNAVSPRYFATMRIPLLRGRDFLDFDNETSQSVAIVNEAMAAKYWPNQDPLGRSFIRKENSGRPLRIVGIAKNSRTESLSDAPTPFFFLPFAQEYMQPATLQLRTFSQDPASLAHSIVGIIRGLEPQMPVFDVHPMTEALDSLDGTFLYKLGAGLAAALGAIGLLIAIIGVYGVVSYSASQRTHEIGIRMALGAGRPAILKLVLRQGLLIVAVGVVVGILLASGVSRLVANLLVGVGPGDPIAYASAALLLAFVALVACFIPARRATRVDPLVSLRYE